MSFRESHQTLFCYFSQTLPKNSSKAYEKKDSVLDLANTGRKISLLNIPAEWIYVF